jgi:hypothetical protein
MEKMKVVVVGANRYSFEDKSDGKTIEGCKVHYMQLNPESNDNTKGSVPQAANMPFSYFNELGKVPGVYDAVIVPEMRGSKLTLVIKEFEFVTPVSFDAVAK